MTDLTVDSTAREQAAAVAGRADLRPRAARPAPRPDRRAQPAAQRDRVSLDEERARDGSGRRRRGAAARRPASARCTGCRTPSRTPTTWPAGGRRTARRCTPTTSPTPTSCSSSGSAGPGRSTIGKTNVPEFAAGSHTFNPVFGTTRNPVDPTRSAGGSSAEERRARWPPAWCRSPTAPTWAARCATPRRSAAWSGSGRRSAGCRTGRPTNYWDNLSTGGPMARNVGDLALLLSVMAGPDRAYAVRARRPRSRVRAARRRHRSPGCGSPCPPTSAAPFEVDDRGRRGRVRVRDDVRRRRRHRRRGEPRPVARPTTSSAPCGPGSSRPAFGELLAEHPDGVQGSPSPTTSGPGSRSPAPTSPARSSAAPP